ncbi:MAG: hypothetical protein ABI641_06450 [Caldimonas sp.]
MSVEELVGKYNRLKNELAQAYGEPAWHAARVDRLANEIVMLERQIAQSAPHAVGAQPRAAASPESVAGRASAAG